MNDEKSQQICKTVPVEKGVVLKECSRDKRILVYQPIKIVDNKVTFIVHRAELLNTLDGNKDFFSLCTVGQVGDSISIKCDKEVIDKIIVSFGDIIPVIFHKDGIVKSILIFDEVNSSYVSPERLKKILFCYSNPDNFDDIKESALETSGD